MMKRLIFILTITLYCTRCYSHQSTIKGSVRDSDSKVSITGVTVNLIGTNQVTSTDLLGNFYFPDVHPGKYDIKISFIGYSTHISTIELKEGETLILTIDLSPKSLDLNEVVVSQPGGSGSSQLINKIDIHLRPANSSQDILKIIPGLVVAQHAGGGKAEQIYLRGFDIDHGTDIRLSVDGMPVNMVSHAHGQGYADLHFVTPELIESVDFNKGPYYVQQGDFTTAGYASFNTRNILDKSSLKLEMGQFDSYRAAGMFEVLKKENQNAYLSTDYQYTNGYFNSPQAFNRINLFGKYHAIIDENKILSVSLSTFTSKWDASGQIPDRAVKQGLINRFGAIDNKEGGNTNRSNANLKLVKILDNGSVFKQQAFFVNYNFELYSNFTFFLEDTLNGDQIRQKEKRNIYGYNTSYNFDHKLFEKKVHSEVGLQLRYDEVQDVELSHTKQRRITLEERALGDINQINMGAYTTSSIALGERISVDAGLRFDQFQFEYVDQLDSIYTRNIVSKSILSPKLNFFYSISHEFEIYLKTGTGFHSNDARVVVSRKGERTLPKAYGADLGFFIKPVKRFLINAAVWQLDMEQEFVYVGDAAIVEPSGYTRRYGFDLSLRYQLANGLFADIDGNYTVPRNMDDPEGLNFIPLAPTFTSIGGLMFKTKNGINASLRYRHVGDRSANQDKSVLALGYTLVDAVVSYTQSHYEIKVSVENLLNKEWNEAQFETESKLRHEVNSVSELHYTPGTPLFIKCGVSAFF